MRWQLESQQLIASLMINELLSDVLKLKRYVLISPEKRGGFKLDEVEIVKLALVEKERVKIETIEEADEEKTRDDTIDAFAASFLRYSAQHLFSAAVVRHLFLNHIEKGLRPSHLRR